MTPAEKARQIKTKFIIMPDENDAIGKMTFGQVNKMLIQNSLACINILIEERERRPASYWKSVKKELEAL